MCGIAGIINFSGEPVCEKTVKNMTDIIAHRGPDDEGVYISGPVGLGQRRLSIIDLSPAGRQPMSNEDGSVWITFNGEIYNFHELRPELEKCGHIFRSHCDTEVIIHAYEEWGLDCLERFNGMFAFAVWDEKKRRLFLARDRLGIKPLFFAALPGRFLFGSEIKAILTHTAVSREVDYTALSYFTALNWMPAPRTLFARVRQLLPGHYMTVSGDGEIDDQCYWEISFERESSIKSLGEATEKFNALFEDSVRSRLVCDVPFGGFLSGGIDSSTVCYWMAKHLNEPLKTFSINFGEPSFDEGEYARCVANSIGSQHHQIDVTAELATVLPKIVWHSEEPTADSSMVAVWYLCQETRKHVTMVHSGDGGDEILAGYETYQARYAHRMYKLIPAIFRKSMIEPLVRGLPASDKKVSWDFKLKQFVRAGALTSEDAHACWRMIFGAPEREKLFEPISNIPETRADVINLYRDYFSKCHAQQSLNRLLFVDTRLYLPNDMLVKVDRMSMAHALEVRVPFLDYRVVELAFQMHPQLKLHNMMHKKYVLKKAMAGKLPKHILWRKKAGFNVPNARWIKGELKSFVTDHLSPSRVRSMGILANSEVQKLLDDHFREKAENAHQIWNLLTLSLWWQAYVEGKAVS